jgi:hypothetical protein
MSQTMVRVSFTIPPQVRANLDHLSGRLGVSKSALITELLEAPLGDLRELMDLIPENPTPEDVLRARGKSNSLIAHRLRSLRATEGDLFSEHNL